MRYLPVIQFERKAYPITWVDILLAVVFGLVGALASPFTYDRGGNGRYLLPVYRDINPALFQDDIVVDTYNLFASLYYDALGVMFAALNVSVEAVPRVMFGMNIIYKMALFVALLYLVRAFSDKALAFGLMALVALFEMNSLLGGAHYFTNGLAHTEVALVLGILGLGLLFRGRQIGFWLCAGLAIFAHSLVGLHLGMVMLPVLLLDASQRSKQMIAGLGIFVGCALAYALLLSPPGMTPAEVENFLLLKGSIYHISPFGEDIISYVTFGLLASVALLGHWRTRGSEADDTLAVLIAVGTVITLSAATVGVVIGSARFAQLQLMRGFLWVTFFMLLLIALSAARTEEKHTRVLLIGVLVYLVLPYFWLLMVMVAAIGYLIAADLRVPEWFLTAAVGLVFGMIGIAWLAELVVGTGIASLNLVSALTGILLVILLFVPQEEVAAYVVLGLVMVVAVVGRGQYAYEVLVAEPTDEWSAVLNWVETNTSPDDVFIALPERDLRGQAYRTTLNVGSSAMVWVDPSAWDVVVEINQQVQDADNLLAVARELGADYVLVQGIGLEGERVFESGEYAIYATQGE